MANDRITMIKLKRMLQLLDADKSMNDICRESSAPQPPMILVHLKKTPSTKKQAA